jgi:hypothetical protein
MATKTNVKHEALSVSEKLEIVQKVDAQPDVTCAKVLEQLSISLSVLNNIMMNKKNIVICV